MMTRPALPRRRVGRIARAATRSALLASVAFASLVALAGQAAAEPAAAVPEAGAAAQAPARDLSAYKEEQISGGALAAGAYMVMWVLVAVFVGRVAKAQSRTEAALRDLEDRVDASHGARAP